MQKSFRTFKDYIEHNYYDKIVSICKGYVFHNKPKFSTNYIPSPNYVAYSDFDLMGINFKDTGNSDQISFYLAIIVYAEIKGYGGKYKNRNYDEDSASTWIGIPCTAILRNGITNVSFGQVEDYSKQRFDKNKTLTKHLVPYFYTDELENRAEMFLRKYYPQALAEPISLPVDEIIKKMNLKICYSPLTDSIFGRTYFADSEEMIYDQRGNLVKSVVKKGTIMMNHNVSFMESVGNENNTKIHECVHWEYHKKFFELQLLLNPENKAMSCTTVDKYIKQGTLAEEIEWMEWQANQLAPRILMPERTTKQKFREILKEVKTQFPTIKKSQLYEYALNQAANFFDVTPSAMKVRLFQLGFKEVGGSNSFVDKKPRLAYSYESESIKEEQTYRIDFIDSVIIRICNLHIRPYLEDKKIVYADGFFAINDPKYVTKDSTGKTVLTEYAREHVDECCLVFNIVRNFKTKLDGSYYSMCYLCRNASADGNVRTELNVAENQNKRVLGIAGPMELAIDEEMEAFELVKQMNGTFAEAFEVWFQHEGFRSNDACAKPAKLHESSVRNYRTGKEEPKLKNLLAICGAHKVYPRITKKLLACAGYTLGQRYNELEYIYLFLVEQCFGEGLDSWNKRLNDYKKGECLP